MHPRNRHQDRYPLKELCQTSPGLTKHVLINKYGDETIDFADPAAVKALNEALLKFYYHIDYWDIPDNYLCPPIPGRADYIHSVADLFDGKKSLKVLDIGTGANCIYPLIGHSEYDWQFVGTDVDPISLQNAEKIIQKNNLSGVIKLRLQTDRQCIFKNIILPDNYFHLVMCNPPFHESLEEATKGSQRKWKNLGKKPAKALLNFGGQGAELWCPGGERSFIHQMINESLPFAGKVEWFTSLVSKEENLYPLQKVLQKIPGIEIKIIEMTQGHKKSRFIAWKLKA
ncbi:MAG: 23S rRNA (adenine(1618)-N(6))-methyltransferase RlmF [Bacteriovoracaceae bacterium]|nr:23S rRNA (adenine(1618)-N(6))-methyltransferase RlmF [Bacteriovoracaceae bacterium]